MTSAKIRIEIIDDSGNEDPSAEQDEDESNVSNSVIKTKEKDEKLAKKAVAMYFLKLAMKQTEEVADQALNVWYQTEEDYLGQTNVSNAKTAISIAKSIGTTAMAGFSIEKHFGTVGVVARAAVLTVSGLFTTAYNAYMNVQKSYISLDNQAYSQYYNSERYGLINGSSGTEN